MNTPIAGSHARTDDRSMHAALRREVLALRGREGRARFDSVVHVGDLTEGRCSCPLPTQMFEVLDPGTRTEVVTALLERLAVERKDTAPAQAWLSRYGEPEVQDEDLAWLAAASRAFDMLELRLAGFWAITRTGWVEVRTGEQRVWKRPRA